MALDVHFGHPENLPSWPRYRLVLFSDKTLSYLGQSIELDQFASKLPIHRFVEDGRRLGINPHVDVPLKRVEEVLDALKSTFELNENRGHAL